MPTPTDNAAHTAQRARQKRTITILAIFLIIGGIVVLFLLKRMFLPMRILVGLIDIVAGCVLLVVLRPKFREPPNPGVKS